MRLRLRVLLLVAAALVPAVAVQALYEREARRVREAQTRDQALSLVQLVSADLESVFDGARQFLLAASGLEALRGHDPEICSRSVLALQQEAPRYANIAVVDATGHVVC